MEEIIILIFGAGIGYYFGRQKFKFESLHKKRFETLAEIYRMLLEVHTKAKQVVFRDGQKDPDKFLEDLYSYHDSLFTVDKFVKETSIFLSPRESELVNRFIAEVEKFENNLGYKKFMEISQSEDFNRGEIINEIKSGVYDAIPKILAEIEKEFRSALGLKS